MVPFQIVLKGPKQTTEAKRERITTTENSVAVELVTRHPNNFRRQEHEQPQDFFIQKCPKDYNFEINRRIDGIRRPGIYLDMFEQILKDNRPIELPQLTAVDPELSDRGVIRLTHPRGSAVTLRPRKENKKWNFVLDRNGGGR